MSKFTTRRYEQILTQMLAKLVSRTNLSDISDTSVWKHLAAAAARQDDEQYYQMFLLLQLFSIDTATGDDLDERAKDIQPGIITRRAAAKANGNLIFSRAGVAGTTSIPIGTKVKTAAGIIFTTTAAGSITPGNNDSSAVPAIADLPGLNGNVIATTIVKFVQKPTGVDSVNNPAKFLNGLDKETDSSFRNRLKQYISGLARSTVDSLEGGVLGATDEDTGATILYSKAVEDLANLGNVDLYIDDGTGGAESNSTSVGTVVVANFTWNGTTTVAATGADTSELAVDDYIGLTTDKQFFKIVTVNAGVSVIISNPGALSIPSGAGASKTTMNPENLCAGLAGPPADHAAGGETYLRIDNVPIKSTVGHTITSSTQGILVENTDYYINPASGQVNFLVALSAGEAVFALYTYYTGLIALAQKIVDGDLADRENYPGLRAAGVVVYVKVPSVQTQTVTVAVVVMEGYDHTTIRTNVQSEITAYINSLGISGDLLLSELYYVIMSVAGVYNVIISIPAADVILLDDQLPRSGTITVN